ncbi:MAG: hypothetical protein IPL04_08510 [Chitinophagaceae bacterium]|nr:hypothetical protein [Chitinophagaceae bacterium]
MWLFRKKRKKDESGINPSMSDKAAGKIAGAGIRLQKAFSESMNKIFKNMTTKKLKVLLIIFCISAGGYSIYLITNAVVRPDKIKPDFKIDHVNVPKHFDKAGDEIMPDAYVDEETFYKIQDFKKYMDSLKQNQNKQYDSILQARPGLMDSVQMLEEIYNSQKQK